MIAVHDVSMRISIKDGFQFPFAVTSLTLDEGFGLDIDIDLKARAVLIGKEAVEDMIALVCAGSRHVDALSGIAVEVASHNPDQGNGLSEIVFVELIEVALAVLIGAKSRRGVEREEQ